MKMLKSILLLLLTGVSLHTFAQEMPADIKAALKADDPAKLSAFITKDNINNCYTDGSWQYSLLAQTVRSNAKKCFDLLIEKGVDVNKACNGYVPPLMHAAKYGRLEMVKVLVAKGANVHYQYDGEYEPASGETPLTYAEKNNQSEVAAFLRTKQ
jgi:ankyrin repeat protein